MKNRHIIDSSTKPHNKPFDSTDALEITRVAPGSPAHALGLSEGDYIALVDATPALEVELADYILEDDNPINYFFFRKSDNALIEADIEAVPLGVITEPSTQGIIKLCREDNFYCLHDDLTVLWKRGDWNALYTAAKIVHDGNLVTRLVRLFNKKYDADLEILFMGAALFEQGQQAEGMPLIEEFMEDHMDGYVLSLHAIAYYYCAKWAKLNNDSDQFNKYLDCANEANGGSLQRINQLVESTAGHQVENRYKWKNRDFPVHYQLRSLLDKNRTVSLKATLESMNSHELLPVCVMPSWRGNGPYTQAMEVFRGVYKALSDVIRPMHVITDVMEKDPNNLECYAEEEKAIESGIKIEVLYDEDREVADRLDQNGSPNLYLLNAEGKVMYNGSLAQDYDYWLAASQVKQTAGKPSTAPV